MINSLNQYLSFGQNSPNNKMIALFDEGSPSAGRTGATEFYGFGINNGVLRYQANSGAQHIFYVSTTQVCGMSTSTLSAPSFSATSDYRIKEDIQPLDETFVVDNLKPILYKNKNNKNLCIGFLAHEVQEHFPYLVQGEKDGQETQSLNYIGLIGVLVKEIQDLKRRVKTLENT